MKLPPWLSTLLRRPAAPAPPPSVSFTASPAEPVVRGYPMKVESLDVKMQVRRIKTLRWIGQGPEPARRRPWVEWVRERVFRLAPRWRPLTWDEMVGEIGWPKSLPPPTPVPARTTPARPFTVAGHLAPEKPGICTCPLGRPVGLPHRPGCPRATSRGT